MQEDPSMEKTNSQSSEPQESDGTEELSDNLSLGLAEQERDQFRALAQRVQADFVNYKRRIEEERQELVRNASVSFIHRLLPVIDDFQLALEHVPKGKRGSWFDGIELILRKLQSTLDSEGVTSFGPELGSLFDPSSQEAVFYEQVEDQEPGSIVRVFRPGYKIFDKILRPAQVSVAQAKEG